MKIKMSPFSSLESVAKNLGVDVSLVREYQKARSAWKSRVNWYAKKYGGVESMDIPKDIRQLEKTSNIEDFIESRIETIKSRTRSASAYIRERQRQYIANVASVSEEKYGDVITPQFLKNLSKMGSKQLSDVIKAIGTDVLERYYPDGDNDYNTVDAQNAISRARNHLKKGMSRNVRR